MTKRSGNAVRANAWAVPAIALLAVLGAVLLWAGPGGAGPSLAADGGNCDPVRPHEPGRFDRTIDSGGLTREYILHVPTSYSGAEAVPLLFNFHGFTSNAIHQDVYSELPAKAEEEGFILVTPQGTPNDEGLLYWNSSRRPAPGPDDVAFVDELLYELEAQLCIDPLRVFSTGISNGAMMSSQLACSISDRIAAIAPVAGARFFGESCSPRPVPVIAFHGTEDLLIPVEPIEESVIPAWGEHNGCATVIEQDPLPGTVGVRLLRYEDCVDDATVELYVVFDADPDTPGEQGGGHSWPGSSQVPPPPWDQILGLTTHEVSANDLMWEFFLRHPMPAGQLRPTPTATARPAPTATALAVGLPDTGAADSSGSAGIDGPLITAIAGGAVALSGAAWCASKRWVGS